MVKVQGRMFGDPVEYSEHVVLDTLEDYNKVIHAYVTSTYAYIYATDLSFRVPIVLQGNVLESTYNYKELIMTLVNNPEVFEDDTFPFTVEVLEHHVP